MINSEETLKQLLRVPESEVLEFKEAKKRFDNDEIGRYFSALSNEANLKKTDYAWLIFGINDKQQIVGSQYRNTQDQLERLKQEVAQHLTNGSTFIDIHTTHINKKRVILFQIPKATAGIPVAWKGHYYGRNGSSLVALSLDKIERIRQKHLDDWSKQICSKATVADLDPDALLRARHEFGVKNVHLTDKLQQWNDATFLNKAKLSIDGKITRTAILLLGKPESSHFLDHKVTEQMSWILQNVQSTAKDYQHFGCPILLTAEQLISKIRRLKYRYLLKGELFPEEVDQYDDYVIREALNNAIAHQDYTLHGRIRITEYEDRLIFNNVGSFIPGSIEEVINTNSPSSHYRNPFLANAMVSLGMIDTIGSGISQMFTKQKERYFPLPEYVCSDQEVNLTIIGKVLDINYATKLATIANLTLHDSILLDRVQKQKTLTNDQIKYLRKKDWIEGRKPNIHISSTVAKHSGEQSQYIKNKSLDDPFYKQLILKYLGEFSTAKSKDFQAFILPKLPDILSTQQKINKLTYLLQSLKKENKIILLGKYWQLSK